MSKNLGPKCKQCRRESTKLLLKGDRCQSSKCAMVKRNYQPGVHGVKRAARLTEYGLQLREKQKAKRYYGLLERQFSNYYEKAIKQKGNTIDSFIQMLERRLDNVVYSLGYAKSRRQARELVNHRHFKVNGRRVNIPSYQLKLNDEIELVEKSKTNKFFQDIIKELPKARVPDWLNLDVKNLKAKVIEMPSNENIKPIFNTKLIIEFYSR
ncbi:MAG: 30S ribosomal protein S4 [bacterium]